MAYIYTNIGNNLGVLTDCSDYPLREDPRWNDYASVPILELTSLFYKRIGNIDAFPFLLHHECKEAEQYANVIKGL